MEHTKTPWRIGNQINSLSEQHHEIRKDKRVLFTGNNNFYEQACIDASFIVRAVNSHEELVSQLKHALSLLEEYEKFEDESAQFYSIRQAIAKAESK